MSSAKFVYLVVGIISCSAIAPQVRAAVVYSSFVSAMTYPCCVGDMVSGPTASNQGKLIGQEQVAGAFSPASNFNLTQIDVAFYFAGSPNTNGFILSLNQDSGGIPGSAIETWTGLTAPSQPDGTSSLVETVFPVSSVPLLAGMQYWLVASPAASDTFDVWNLNATGLGPGGIIALNRGSGWVLNVNLPNSIAFDVQGTATPEPGPLLLVSSALIGLSLIGKRRRKKNN